MIVNAQIQVKEWIRGHNYATKIIRVVCSIILPCIIKIFLTVAELCSQNENEVKIWIRGQNYKKDKQSCLRHSMLTCSIILQNIIKIFLMVTELYSGNVNKGRVWIRGHN